MLVVYMPVRKNNLFYHKLINLFNIKIHKSLFNESFKHKMPQ